MHLQKFATKYNYQLSKTYDPQIDFMIISEFVEVNDEYATLKLILALSDKVPVIRIKCNINFNNF
jgi:hypothetical protein